MCQVSLPQQEQVLYNFCLCSCINNSCMEEESVGVILGLAPQNYMHSIENQILVKIKLKRDTRLQKKNQAELFFLQPW